MGRIASITLHPTAARWPFTRIATRRFGRGGRVGVLGAATLRCVPARVVGVTIDGFQSLRYRG